jgi:hypothetical protein
MSASFICESFADEDDGADTRFNFQGVRAVQPEDGLPDLIPSGWAKVWSLGHMEHSLAIGIWLDALGFAQDVTREEGIRRHLVVRDRYGERVLVVHPDLGQDLSDMIDWLDGHTTDCACSDVFRCKDKVVKADDAFARKIWRRAPKWERRQMLQESCFTSTVDEETGLLAEDDEGFVLLCRDPDFNDFLAREYNEIAP